MNMKDGMLPTPRFPLAATASLHFFMAVLAGVWVITVPVLLGHPVLSRDTIVLWIGLVCWASVWQIPYAIMLPHRLLVRRLYSGSLLFWSLLWLLGAFIGHRHDATGWMYHRALRFPTVMAIGGLLFLVCKWASQGLVSKPETTRKRLLILGSGKRASIAWRELRTRYHSAVEVVGFVDERPLHEIAPDLSQRMVSDVNNLSDYLLENVIDEIVLAAPLRSCYDMVARVVEVAEGCGVHLTYMRDVISVKSSRMDGNFEMFHAMIPAPQTDLWRSLLKRSLDIVFASTLLILLAPVFLAVAIAIRLTSRGPVFFVQDRVGYRRRHFPMLKFRSMVHKASELMAGLEADNQASGPLFKMEDDPRITPLGRILRRTSLDELPQLINVFAGDMSLVGPRPMSLRDVDHIKDVRMLRRFSVKPGMTGMWQINGRSSTSAHQWLAMDAHYIDRWSVALDVQLILRTVPAVLRRSGAL